MSIINELSQFLYSNLKELDTKARDIDLILYFYGFKDDIWPTLDDAALKCNIGTSKGRRSERPRQIIQNKFISIVEAGDLPSSKKCSDYISSQKIHRTDALYEYLLNHEILEDNVNLRGVMNLLHNLKLCEGYEIYNPNLEKTTRNTYDTSSAVFLIDKDLVAILKKALKSAKVLPGLLGIANLSFLKQELSTDFQWFDELVEILRLSNDSWFYINDDEEFYLMESGANTLINNLKKVRCVTAVSTINELTVSLSNSLRRRTPQKYSYPPEKIIELYLKNSRHTKINGNNIILNIEQGELTEIDKDIIEFMEGKNSSDFHSLSSHLVKKGHEKPIIDKSVLYSPLIHIDKSLGRAHYIYSIVGNTAKAQDSYVNVSKYEIFKQRLLAISTDGTDNTQIVIMRKEQHILAEWLFDGKSTELCAICNNEYSIPSLVTAHKKKRADCAENERIDPNIVMPLCYYGCDYIYEKGYIYINIGKVCSGVLPDNLSLYERSVINAVIGNDIQEKWLQGSIGYFRKPVKQPNSSFENEKI